MPADSASHSVPAKCATCNGPMASPVFCDNCRSLYPADELNYYELLGLVPAFNLDPAELRQKYLSLSRKVHPDRHGEPDDADMSMRLSARLNEAYRVLGDPILRAEYLLELCGGRSAADDRSVLPDVLSNTLMLRDEAAEARAGGDAAALEQCRSTARGQYESVLEQITELAGLLPGDAALWQRLRATLNSMKYYQKLLAEV